MNYESVNTNVPFDASLMGLNVRSRSPSQVTICESDLVSRAAAHISTKYCAEEVAVVE